MANLNQRLSEIRELQGKSPLPNPNQIMGFGAHDPPAPPPPEDLDPSDEEDLPPGWLDPDDEPPAQKMIPSPLVPVVKHRVMEPEADLLVMDGRATFKGRPVRLTEKEQASVIRIVLRSIQRDAAEQLASLTKKKT
jgi:hypothetical protein